MMQHCKALCVLWRKETSYYCNISLSAVFLCGKQAEDKRVHRLIELQPSLFTPTRVAEVC